VRPEVPCGTEAISGTLTVLCPACLERCATSCVRRYSLDNLVGRSCGALQERRLIQIPHKRQVVVRRGV
jgi:hypothetical protein